MIRYRIATGAAALALAMVGVIGTGAAGASAASGDHICELSSQSLCLHTEGLGQLHVQSTGSLTNFSAINAGGPGGVYFEYEQAGTKDCLVHASNGDVEMAACKAGTATQLWEVNSKAELVNDSGGECMAAPNLFTIVESCGDSSSTNNTWSGTA
jgi:hypothetical protein